jgi:hypothetical protein
MFGGCVSFDQANLRRKVALLERLKYQFEQLGRDNVLIRQAQQIATQEKWSEEYAWLIAAIHLAEQNRVLMQTAQVSVPVKEDI